MTDPAPPRALDANAYDEQWSRLHDFLKYNPGARHRRRLMLAALRSIHAVRRDILDVGCGLGETIAFLAPALPDARFTGLDLSPLAIRRCRDVMPQHQWEVLDVARDRLDRRFDVIICSEVLEHLEDPRAVVANLVTMLADDGLLLVTVPHGPIFATERAVGHVHHPTTTELREWMANAGLVVEKLRRWGWPGYAALKHAANLRPDATMKTFGSGSYGRAARAFNGLAYAVTGASSLPSSKRGVQTVMIARRMGSAESG